MKRTESQTLKEVLNHFLDENPLLRSKLLETRLINAWEIILGKLAQQYTDRIYIRNKVLHVHLSSSVLKNELIICKEELVLQLNQVVGEKVISSIILY